MTCALLQIVAQLVRVQTCQKSAMTAGQERCHFPAELCPMQSINLLDMISDTTMIYGPRPGACIQAALPFATRRSTIVRRIDLLMATLPDLSPNATCSDNLQPAVCFYFCFCFCFSFFVYRLLRVFRALMRKTLTRFA